MSTPIKADDIAPLDACQSALGEIISAESALNMHPEPMSAEMQAEKGEAGEIRGYLSEVDGMAAHAMEHLHAAFALVNKAHQQQEALKAQVYRLVTQLREAGLEPKHKTWLDDADDFVDLMAEQHKKNLIDLANNGFDDGGF